MTIQSAATMLEQPGRQFRPRRIRRRKEDVVSQAGGLRRPPFSLTALSVLGVFALLPVLVLVFNAFKSDSELATNPLGLPTSWSLANFSQAWSLGRLGQGLQNSVVLVAGTVIGIWICAGMAAYALARLDVPFKRGIMFYLLVVISLPAQMFLVPLFFLWTRLGLYDNLFGLILMRLSRFPLNFGGGPHDRQAAITVSS